MLSKKEETSDLLSFFRKKHLHLLMLCLTFINANIGLCFDLLSHNDAILSKFGDKRS
jgi:hypothetical protein